MATPNKLIEKWQTFLEYEQRQKSDLQKMLRENSGLGSMDCEDTQWDCKVGIQKCDHTIMLIKQMISDLNYLV